MVGARDDVEGGWRCGDAAGRIVIDGGGELNFF